jgi:hypothetical protein
LESEECPTYAGEEEWIEEQKVNKAINRLSGKHDSIPYVD